MEHPWLLEQCKIVQSDPDSHLDLWAREHYKSTIITFGLTIQDVLSSHGEGSLSEKEKTIGIFSHTRSISKKFLRQIKLELERNRILREDFPDVLYWNPDKESPLWSLDAGLVVKRQSNPKESTIEAWGVVDSQPTSAHFDVLVYDDIVTRDSVTTPDMIERTTSALELSYNLGANGGTMRFIGTRYHFNDTYRTLMDRGTAIARVKPATEDGTYEGEPVLLTKDALKRKLRDQGIYTFSCQMLQNPLADRSMGFHRDWLKFYERDDSERWLDHNRYILADPANEKKRNSDRTAIVVMALGPDMNYKLVDAVYDRLSIKERTRELMRLHRKWKPIAVGYEKYGKDVDIEYIKLVQGHERYFFDVIPLGGSMPKNDRIRRLMPLFESSKIWLPPCLFWKQYDGKTIDIVKTFIDEEFDTFPVGAHDDMLDILSRIVDDGLGAMFPMEFENVTPARRRASWSA